LARQRDFAASPSPALLPASARMNGPPDVEPNATPDLASGTVCGEGVEGSRRRSCATQTAAGRRSIAGPSRGSRSSSATLRWVPRRSHLAVSSANQRSTRFSQDAEIGVKCTWKRGWASSHRWIAGVLRVEALSMTMCTSSSAGRAVDRGRGRQSRARPRRDLPAGSEDRVEDRAGGCRIETVLQRDPCDPGIARFLGTMRAATATPAMRSPLSQPRS